MPMQYLALSPRYWKSISSTMAPKSERRFVAVWTSVQARSLIQASAAH